MKTLARPRDRAEVLARLARVHPDSARRWGTMTAHQMVCHLSDAFRMATGQKPVSRATSLVQQTIAKWLALYAPLHWPPGIPTRPEIDQSVSGTCPSEFSADIAELAKQVELFTSQPTSFDWPEHPIFGKLSARAWLRWGYLHMDHHFRQFGI
jgi:hypothetical protein